MENKELISFGLRKIATEQFAIIDSAFNESDKKIGLNTSLKFGVDIKKRIISVLLLISFNKDKSPFLLLETGCYFEIAKESWDSILSTDNKINIPMVFAKHLVMLTVGTSRGILHSKTENTIYNKFVLPTINVNNLVKDDVLIDINNDNI